MNLPRSVLPFALFLIVIVVAQTAEAALALSFQRTDVSCNGGSNGRLAVTVTGGSGQYAYSWSPGVGSGPQITGLSAGTYRVTVEDLVTSETVTSDPQPVFQPASPILFSGSYTTIACAGGSNGAAAVTPMGGTPPYSFQWTTGETGPLISGLSAGTYAVTVSDSNHCQATRSFNITEPPPLQVTVPTQTNLACHGGANGSLTAAATGGTSGYTYSWTGTSQTTQTATGLAAGAYTVTVTDMNACTASASATITQPAAPLALSAVQTNIACNGGSNGDIRATASGGTGAYSYSWSPNFGSGPHVSGLVAGSYSLTVTDENACSLTRSFTLNEPSAVGATVDTVTSPSCHGGTNGSAAISASGGTPGFTYAWSPSGQTTATASGLAAGAHTVTVTDANACQVSRVVTVAEPAPLEVTASGTGISCHGGSDGTASAGASGGTGAHTFAWSPTGGTAANATGLDAGVYTVTVSDDNACTASASVTLSEPSPAVITVDAIANATCHGSADGGASVSVAGGTPGYTYAWSPSGGTEPGIEGQPAGTYTVTVSDANACETTHSLAIAEPEAIVVSLAASTPADCSDAPAGELTVSVSGGSEGYAYDWSPGEPTGDGTESISGLAVGAYDVRVEDMNGCAGEGTFEVVAASDITPVATGSSATVAQDGSVALTLMSTYAGCFDRIYRIVDGPKNGTLDGTPPEVVYIPAPGYFGSDAFTFEVTAGSETSAPAIVAITVTETPLIPENTVPTAHAMTVTTEASTPVTLTLSGSDLDGDPLTFAVKTEPQFGTLTGTPPLLTYTPIGSSAYEEAFTFVADDGKALSAPATVSVIVEAPVDPGEDPVEPGKTTRKKDDGGGCSAAENGELLAGLLLVGAFLGLRRHTERRA